MRPPRTCPRRAPIRRQPEVVANGRPASGRTTPAGPEGPLRVGCRRVSGRRPVRPLAGGPFAAASPDATTSGRSLAALSRQLHRRATFGVSLAVRSRRPLRRETSSLSPERPKRADCRRAAAGRKLAEEITAIGLPAGGRTSPAEEAAATGRQRAAGRRLRNRRGRLEQAAGEQPDDARRAGQAAANRPPRAARHRLPHRLWPASRRRVSGRRLP